MASRSVSTSGATPSRSRNSENRVTPKNASRRIRNVQRSPSTHRLRAIEHISSGGVAAAGSSTDSTVAFCGEVLACLRGDSFGMISFYP